MREMLIPAGEPYPAGERGEFAVGHYTRSGGTWRLLPVGSRHQAEKLFREILGHDDVLHVVLQTGPHQGRSSAVAWVARCNGGEDWTIIEETEGMREYRPED